MGDGYRTVTAFETPNYYVNICQQGQRGRLLYSAWEKRDPSRSIAVPAYPINNGYRADNQNTSYLVTRSDGQGWVLQVLQDGQVIAREPQVTPSQPNRPNPPEEGIPGPDYTLTCNGQISNRNLYFSVKYTKEGGFGQFEVREGGTNRLVQQGAVSYSEMNPQEQPVFRGAAGNAEVVVVGLGGRTQEPGDEMSFALDGQWGRGTCRR